MSADQVATVYRNSGFVAEVERLMQERGMTTRDLKLALYGVNANGNPKGTGNFYSILRGQRRLNLKNMDRWAKALSVAPEALLAAYRTSASSNPPRVVRDTGVTPTPTKSSNRFHIVTEDDGTVTFSCRVVGLDFTTALRIGQAVAIQASMPSEKENQNGN